MREKNLSAIVAENSCRNVVLCKIYYPELKDVMTPDYYVLCMCIHESSKREHSGFP